MRMILLGHSGKWCFSTSNLHTFCLLEHFVQYNTWDSELDLVFESQIGYYFFFLRNNWKLSSSVTRIWRRGESPVEISLAGNEVNKWLPHPAMLLRLRPFLLQQVSWVGWKGLQEATSILESHLGTSPGLDFTYISCFSCVFVVF